MRQLPHALSSWPELERQKAGDAQPGFTAAAMACTADIPLPAQSPGLASLSVHCRQAIFAAGGSNPLTVPAAVFAQELLASAAAISEPKGMEPMLGGLDRGARAASGAGSQLGGTSVLGWALSLHALYAVLPTADLPPLQHYVNDLPWALATIFNEACSREVCQSRLLTVVPDCRGSAASHSR